MPGRVALPLGFHLLPGLWTFVRPGTEVPTPHAPLHPSRGFELFPAAYPRLRRGGRGALAPTLPAAFPEAVQGTPRARLTRSPGGPRNTSGAPKHSSRREIKATCIKLISESGRSACGKLRADRVEPRTTAASLADLSLSVGGAAPAVHLRRYSVAPDLRGRYARFLRRRRLDFRDRFSAFRCSFELGREPILRSRLGFAHGRHPGDAVAFRRQQRLGARRRRLLLLLFSPRCKRPYHPSSRSGTGDVR